MEMLLHQIADQRAPTPQYGPSNRPQVLDAYGRPYAAGPPPAPSPNPNAHPYWGSNPWQAAQQYAAPPPWAYPQPTNSTGAMEALATVVASVAPVIAERAFEKTPDPNTAMMMQMMHLFMGQNARMAEIQAENQGPDLEGYAALLGALRGGGGVKGMWDGSGTPSAPAGSPTPGSKEDLHALIKYMAEHEPEKLRTFAKVALAAGQKGGNPGPASETANDGGDSPA